MGKISGIEDEYYKYKKENISYAIVWYENIKVLISCTHLRVEKANKSMIREILEAEIDFVIIDENNNKEIVKLINSYPLSLSKADKLILEFPNMEELENIDCKIPFLYTTYPELVVLNNDED